MRLAPEARIVRIADVVHDAYRAWCTIHAHRPGHFLEQLILKAMGEDPVTSPLTTRALLTPGDQRAAYTVTDREHAHIIEEMRRLQLLDKDRQSAMKLLDAAQRRNVELEREKRALEQKVERLELNLRGLDIVRKSG